MLSAEKDRRSGRVGRLLAALRRSRAGPLPVQTGFPTSLADLVVKNRGRLKKQPTPSSKRRNGGVAASPSPSPSPSPPPSSPPPPPPPRPQTTAISQSDRRPRSDLLPDHAFRREQSGAFGLGLGFLAFSGVVSLALLVIWSKKVVAAVTVAAFSLFLLESVKCTSLPRRKRPAATERQVYLDGRGRVSPIREVDAESTEPSQPSCPDPERGVEAFILSAEEKSGVLDEPSDPKAKTKKGSWKKPLAGAKKLHKGRRSKDAEDRLGSSFRSEGDRADATVRGNVTATDFSGSRRGMGMADAVASEPESLGSCRSGWSVEINTSPMEADAPAELTKTERVEERVKAGIRFPALVLVAVVLVGLVAGMLPAVAFTVLCAALFSPKILVNCMQ